MPRRVIDLSQPLSRESQLHPFFPPTQILRHIQHTDAAAGDPSFSAEIIITSNHAATHVDAFGHYQPAARRSQEMPLDTFCGEAICVDIRDYPGGHDVTADEVSEAVDAERPGAARRRHRPLLHATTTTARPGRRRSSTGSTASRPRPCTGSPTGGVKIFGVETISPDLVYLDRRVPDAPRLRGARAHALREPEQPRRGARPALPVLRVPAQARDGVRLARAGGRDPRRLSASSYATSSIAICSGSIAKKPRRNSACVQRASFGTSLRSSAKRAERPGERERVDAGRARGRAA